MKVIVFPILTTCFLLSIGQAFAENPSHRLTPTTIGSLQMAEVTVETKRGIDSDLGKHRDFVVTFRSKIGSVDNRPTTSARLLIFGNRGLAVACRIAPDGAPAELAKYTFQVGTDYGEKSVFILSEHIGEDSCYYWFHLNDFMMAENSPSTKAIP